MATQPCPNIASVVFKLTSDSQSIQNTMYFEKSGGWVAGDMADLASTAEGAWLANMLGHYCNDVTFIGVTATDLTDLTGERSITTPDFGNVGTALGESAPANVAFAIQQQTGNRGRGKQGRLFYGPIPNSNVRENVMTQAAADAVVSAWEAVVTAILAGVPGTTHVVLSRYQGGAKRPSGIGLPVFGLGYSNLYIDSQRDRLPFHKRRKHTTP